ncbi:MAG: hypothetical protein ACRD0U_17835 [Acidimicrobiales bacterium]
MDVRNEHRCYQTVYEFDIEGTNTYTSEEPIDFGNGIVDFCFYRRTGDDEPVTAHVKLFDPETYTEFTGGQAEIELPPGSDERVYLSFDSFGWRDDEMQEPVGICTYEIWLEGSDSSGVRVEVLV